MNQAIGRLMLNRPFPAYQTAGIAARWGCYSCCTKLDPATLRDSGYPPGRGQYSMQCAHCKTYTWFDLTQKSESSNA